MVDFSFYIFVVNSLVSCILQVIMCVASTIMCDALYTFVFIVSFFILMIFTYIQYYMRLLSEHRTYYHNNGVFTDFLSLLSIAKQFLFNVFITRLIIFLSKKFNFSCTKPGISKSLFRTNFYFLWNNNLSFMNLYVLHSAKGKNCCAKAPQGNKCWSLEVKNSRQ